MESVGAVLVVIQERLSLIVLKLHEYTCSSDSKRIAGTGEDLIGLADQVCDQLAEAKHRVLFQTLREAGLGLWARATEIGQRDFCESDKTYFTEVHDVLSHLCAKMESGEYYNELAKLQAIRTKGVA
ncbi:MAG: hypothetical protein JTT11_04490 [Candidatus Brockarchaeota archaeon]|nr:hypothetical protein [Candidatus Brockarchaeota archaeon]